MPSQLTSLRLNSPPNATCPARVNRYNCTGIQGSNRKTILKGGVLMPGKQMLLFEFLTNLILSVRGTNRLCCIALLAISSLAEASSWTFPVVDNAGLPPAFVQGQSRRTLPRSQLTAKSSSTGCHTLESDTTPDSLSPAANSLTCRPVIFLIA